MAFDLNSIGGYGNGELGDVIDPQNAPWTSATFSTFGGTEISLINITYDDTIAGNNDFSAWPAGTKVLLVAGRADNVDAGKWGVFTITPQQYQYTGDGNYDLIATLDREFVPENTGQTDGFIVKIAQYRNLTLNSGCTLNAVASLGVVNSDQGGFVALMCSETLTFNGGHIDLRGNFGRGVSYLTAQETLGKLDTDKYSGWENSQTKDRLLLSNGDGLAFIVAKEIVVANDESRIGNPSTYGVQYCRGASDSPNRPAGVTNLGGSTIFMVAGTFTDFTPKLIAKYRTGTDAENTYKGLGRCYIASGTKLTNDEGLYAYDNISNPAVVTNTLKIKSFGDGSNGSTTASVLWNNYAAVTAFSSNRKVLTVKTMTTKGTVPFAAGALVMVHAKNKDSTNTKNVGRFYLATVLGVNGNDITLDTAAPYNTFNTWLDTYYVQILTIPQFTNFSPSKTVGTQIPAWNDANGYGGIFAIACNGTCTLSGRAVNVMGKGGGAQYGRNGLTHIGNAQDCDRLPIGQGYGSVFILAKNLIMNAETRIGATYSGANHHGYLGEPDQSTKPAESGSGAAGGRSRYYDGLTSARTGGYGSNGSSGRVENLYKKKLSSITDHAVVGYQGAHVMIVADTITGFNQAAISTGGEEGCNGHYGDKPKTRLNEGHGNGAGYGGDSGHFGSTQYSRGGYNGGGGGSFSTHAMDDWMFYITSGAGGSSGWAFIYCNNAVNQDPTDTDPNAIDPDQ